MRTIKEECLNHFILVSEDQLRNILKEFVDHYHKECFHQGLGNQLIEKRDFPKSGKVRCKK